MIKRLCRILPPVYPRWRGEHVAGESFSSFKTGLSPLARGTPLNQIYRPSCARFIPAGAGNTFSVVLPAVCNPVYPRWRGEHGCHSLSNGTCNGLSPLARGTRSISPVMHSSGRFIPAGAGNTSGLISLFVSVTVYPRWRGEHRPARLFFYPLRGLSPLARGTPEPVPASVRRWRFIPAGAGNTIPFSQKG